MIWLVQFVNYTLALFMWLILGRAVLGILTGGRPNPLQTIFDRLTQPLFAATRRALPFVGERAAPLVALLTLAALRVALILLVRPSAHP